MSSNAVAVFTSVLARRAYRIAGSSGGGIRCWRGRVTCHGIPAFGRQAAKDVPSLQDPVKRLMGYGLRRIVYGVVRTRNCPNGIGADRVLRSLDPEALPD
jgi:hypothetical protein